MARIRTIKPEMAQDEDLARCSLGAQLLAVRILNHCDDEGLFKANPLLVKSNCFPLLDMDSKNVLGMIQELSSVGYIRVAEGSDGKLYGEIVTFLKHQRIDKPQASKIKELVKFEECSKNVLGTFQGGMEWNGKEWKGKEEDLKHLVPPADEPTPTPPKKKPANEEIHNEDFERIWMKRPERAGADPKGSAREAFNARLKQGATILEIEQGLERYHRFQKAVGNLNTKFVMRLSTFLGPDQHYRETWDLPATASEQRQTQADQAMEKARIMLFGNSDGPPPNPFDNIIQGELA